MYKERGKWSYCRPDFNALKWSVAGLNGNTYLALPLVVKDLAIDVKIILRRKVKEILKCNPA